MYFLISRIRFDPASTEQITAKDQAALCSSIKKKFSVSVRSYKNLEGDGEVSIALACVHPDLHRLNRLVDEIAEYCERQGMGRVCDETSMLEHIEALEDI